MARLLLVLQRTLAFTIDLVIVIALQVTLGVAAVMALIPWGPEQNAAFLVAFIAYFGVFEWRGGRTPGKMLLRIRVVQQDGQAADAFACFSRISLLAFGSAIPSIISGGVEELFHLPAAYDSARTWAPLLLGWLVWPVSIIVGGGVVGAHDVIVGTKVVRSGSSNAMYGPGVPQHYWAKVAGATTLTGLVVLFALGWGTRPMRTAFNQPEYALQVANLTVDDFTLGRRAGDAARLLEGGLSVHFGSAPPFMSDSGFVPPEARPSQILVYDIAMSSEAYGADAALDTIGFALAGELVDRFGPEVFDVGLVLNFVTTRRIGNCAVGLQVARGGFFIPGDSDEVNIVLRRPEKERAIDVEWDSYWLDLAS